MDGFRIKVCGITTVDDALMAVDAGADAIGLNFYPRSPRHIDLPAAQAIAEAVGKRVVKVGVFVNVSAALVLSIAGQVALDLIQFHGDEEPEAIGSLRGRPIIKAFRIGDDGLAPVAAYLQRCGQLGAMPQRVLFDARAEGAYGGSGQTASWETIAAYRVSDASPPLVLAGGLTPENVAAAIEAVRPAAVDTASGVESAPGTKSRQRMLAFVSRARQAFDALG